MSTKPNTPPAAPAPDSTEVTYECADVAKVECLSCGNTETEPGAIDLWNGYGECLKCGHPADEAPGSRWTFHNGTVTVLPEPVPEN